MNEKLQENENKKSSNSYYSFLTYQNCKLNTEKVENFEEHSKMLFKFIRFNCENTCGEQIKTDKAALILDI